MSTHGIRQSWFGRMDDKGKLISDPEKGGLGTDGVYSPTINAEGLTVANYTGLETAGTPQYANDELKRTTTSKMAPALAITALDFDKEQANKMLGYESDDKGGYTLVTPKPHIAILTKAENFDGSYTYEAMANANVIRAGSSHSTDQQNETDANDTFQANGLTPLDPNVFVNKQGNQQPYKVWLSDAKGFDKAAMFKEVFSGYVLSDGTDTNNTDTSTATTVNDPKA